MKLPFEMYFLLFVIFGLLLGFIPIIEMQTIYKDSSLIGFDGILFCGICGLVLGVSSFLLYSEQKKRSPIGARIFLGGNDTFFLILIIFLALSAKKMILESPVPTDVSSANSRLLLMLFILFGTTCYLAGKAVKVIEKYANNKEG